MRSRSSARRGTGVDEIVAAGTYLRGVRAQYEQLPYPPRNPKDELKRLKLTSLDQLPLVNHYCFEGRGDFRNLRVLVAGGGTGDAAIYLAEQLKHTRSVVTYLDISRASMKVAKKRARIRRLKNIQWLHGSVLDLPGMGLGPFDYINCTGVLHHLEDPSAGLKALKSVLAEGGAMGLMVYAQHGRTGIYQMQELMRLINAGEQNIQQQIRNTRAVLESLPATNWFKRGEDLAVDHREFGDVGVFDLFLHSQDRAYTVPELHRWLASCGMQFTAFAFEGLRYQPNQYLSDPKLLSKISALGEVEQQAIAELLSGAITKHAFYCAAEEKSAPCIADEDMVPFLWGTHVSHREAHEQLAQAPGAPIEFISLYLTIEYQPAEYTALVFKHLDGNNSIAEIVTRVAEESNSTDTAAIRKEIRHLYSVLNELNLMFLKHPSVGAFSPAVSIDPELGQ